MLKEFHVDDPDEAELDEFLDRFDPHTPYFARHYYNIIDRIVKKRPVIYSTVYDDGFYVISGYRLLRGAATDVTHFTHVTESMLLPKGPMPEFIPGGTNGSEHRFYRQILNPLFSPEKMRLLGEDIRSYAVSLVQEGLKKGRFDIIHDLARPLTGVTAMRLIGVNGVNWRDYEEPVHKFHVRKEPPDILAKLYVDYEARVAQAVHDLMHDPQTFGAIGVLARETLEERQLTEVELCKIINSIILGGLGTTQATIGSASIYLGRNPERRRELVEHPERIPNAVNEMIRMFPASNFVGRHVPNDVQLDEHMIFAGKVAYMFWASANFDADFVERPFEVDFTRRDSKRLSSFGLGPHMCLGQHLARMQMQIFLEVILEFAPRYELIEEEIEIPDTFGLGISVYSVPVILRA